MTSLDHIKPRYLGDGVYASFDGYSIWLGNTPGHPLVALEPAALRELRAYEREIGNALTHKPAE